MTGRKSEVSTIKAVGIAPTAIPAQTNGAAKKLRPVTLSVGQGRCEGYTINRRLGREGVCLFAPNPDGVRDDEVTVLVFRDAQDGTGVAVLFHLQRELCQRKVEPLR